MYKQYNFGDKNIFVNKSIECKSGVIRIYLKNYFFFKNIEIEYCPLK